MLDEAQHMLVRLLSLLLVLASLICGLSCSRNAHSATSSPWLALRGKPSSRGAIGWLMMGSFVDVEVGEVRWLSGKPSRAKDLLGTPEPRCLPSIGPLRVPAVFAIEGDDALVWSPSHGWG